MNGSEIRVIRAALGDTLEQFGNRFGWTKQYQSLLELGRREAPQHLKRDLLAEQIRLLTLGRWNTADDGDSAFTFGQRLQSAGMIHTDRFSIVWAALTNEEKRGLRTTLDCEAHACGGKNCLTSGGPIVSDFLPGELALLIQVFTQNSGKTGWTWGMVFSQARQVIDHHEGAESPLVRLDTEQGLTDFERGKVYFDEGDVHE